MTAAASQLQTALQVLLLPLPQPLALLTCDPISLIEGMQTLLYKLQLYLLLQTTLASFLNLQQLPPLPMHLARSYPEELKTMSKVVDPLIDLSTTCYSILISPTDVRLHSLMVAYINSREALLPESMVVGQVLVELYQDQLPPT